MPVPSPTVDPVFDESGGGLGGDPLLVLYVGCVQANAMRSRDWFRGIEIEPSLYAADFANLGTQLGQLIDAGARIFHFDVGDGRFVEPSTMAIVLE